MKNKRQVVVTWKTNLRANGVKGSSEELKIESSETLSKEIKFETPES